MDPHLKVVIDLRDRALCGDILFEACKDVFEDHGISIAAAFCKDVLENPLIGRKPGVQSFIVGSLDKAIIEIKEMCE